MLTIISDDHSLSTIMFNDLLGCGGFSIVKNLNRIEKLISEDLLPRARIVKNHSKQDELKKPLKWLVCYFYVDEIVTKYLIITCFYKDELWDSS